MRPPVWESETVSCVDCFLSGRDNRRTEGNLGPAFCQFYAFSFPRPFPAVRIEEGDGAEQAYAPYARVSRPSKWGRRTFGIVTVPSSSWQCSRIATTAREVAMAVLFSV